MLREWNLGWVDTDPLFSLDPILSFERQFRITFPTTLELFLLQVNGGSPVGGLIPTPEGPRSLQSMLDFGKKDNPRGAWALNSRINTKLGAQRVAIGMVDAGDLLCVRREGRDRFLEILDRKTFDFSPACSIPEFLQRYGKM